MELPSSGTATLHRRVLSPTASGVQLSHHLVFLCGARFVILLTRASRGGVSRALVDQGTWHVLLSRQRKGSRCAGVILTDRFLLPYHPLGTSGDGLVPCSASPWEWTPGQDSSMALGTTHFRLLKTGAVVTLLQTWCP